MFIFFPFREVRQETPSHTGGVSEEAIRRREDERKKRDERGITYDSRAKRNEGRDYFENEWRPRGRERIEDKRDRRDKYDREDRHRERNVKERGERVYRDNSERDDGRRRDRDGGRRDNELRRDSDWEKETPRSQRFEDEKLTPLIL